MSEPMTTTELAQVETTEQAEPGELGRLLAKSPRERMAESWGCDPKAVEGLVQNSIVRARDSEPPISRNEVAAACIIAAQYDLNPMVREIYFFRSKDFKSVVPIVGIDGWTQIVARTGQCDGCEFEEVWHDESVPMGSRNLAAITCRIYRKGMTRPVSVTEYMAECRRNSGPWQSHPNRMLRHKAYIQCARIAFAITGLYDEDEGRDAAGLSLSGDGRQTFVPERVPSQQPPDDPGKITGAARAKFIVEDASARGVTVAQLVSAANEFAPGSGDDIAAMPAAMGDSLYKWLKEFHPKKVKPSQPATADTREYQIRSAKQKYGADYLKRWTAFKRTNKLDADLTPDTADLPTLKAFRNAGFDDETGECIPPLEATT